MRYINCFKQLLITSAVVLLYVRKNTFLVILKCLVFKVSPGIYRQTLWFSFLLKIFFNASTNKELVFDFEGIAILYLDKIPIQGSNCSYSCSCNSFA